MEVTNANWKEILIHQGKLLTYDDRVIFTLSGKTRCYRVDFTYLQGINCWNARILDDIGLTTDGSRSDFCFLYYGYSTPGGAWPEYHDKDYKAATQVVMAIYREIEKLELDSLVSTAQEGSISVQEGPISTEAPIKNIDTIKITIEPIQTFKIIL